MKATQKMQNLEINKPAATLMQRQALIDGLNRDLAAEYQSILMYIHYSAKLTGPYRRELRALFEAGVGDDLGHAQFLADKVTGLRGNPTTVPWRVPSAKQPRDMLEQALRAEQRAQANYVERIRQAAAIGDTALIVGLEKRVADKTLRKEAIEHMRSIAPPLVEMEKNPVEPAPELVYG